VQQHLTISNHGYLGYAVIVNKNFWDDLPIDIRTTLTQAINETTIFEREVAQQANDDALAKLAATSTINVYTLSPGQRTSWQRALLPVYQQFDRSIGNYLIKSIGRTAKIVKREQDRARKKQKN
jgi:C4-dicarboxylate-binding protein DctP